MSLESLFFTPWGVDSGTVLRNHEIGFATDPHGRAQTGEGEFDWLDWPNLLKAKKSTNQPNESNQLNQLKEFNIQPFSITFLCMTVAKSFLKD